MAIQKSKCWKPEGHQPKRRCVIPGQLYPALDAIVKQHDNKLGVDLWISGPDAAERVNLQRKIIKGNAYKNWRLDGEFIYNPDGTPERFNVLEPGDIALFAFAGELAPYTVNLTLVGKSAPQDQGLFQGLDTMLGSLSMAVLEGDTLGELCHLQGVPESHPVWSVVEDEDLAEAAAGQAPAVDRILKRSYSPKMSLTELQEARREAERTGRIGEELVDVHLSNRLAAGEIEGYDWISDINAISPYDFSVDSADSTEKLEVKTTKGDFSREFYLSLSELRDMVLGEETYVIGRVYQATSEGGKLRYSHQLREYGQSILDALSSLPEGVMANGVTIRPDEAMFQGEIDLAGPADPEE